MQSKCAQIIDHWLEAANHLDVGTLAALYHDDAVLLPTFSRCIRTSPDAIAAYFSSFKKYQGLRISLDRSSMLMTAVGDATSVSGLYTWNFQLDEEEHFFAARFTFMLLNESKPIVLHHSSLVPEVL